MCIDKETHSYIQLDSSAIITVIVQLYVSNVQILVHYLVSYNAPLYFFESS